MGKIFYNLYAQVCHPLNIWWAYKAAARGKRYPPAVASFEYNLEKNLIEIEHDLKNETYELGGYDSFLIDKPKRRLVNAAPFRDRVVHRALMNVIEPLFERQFIFDSYTNRKGKGTHAALDRCTYYLRRHAYVMHLDVRQFFPAVDHAVLVSILSRTIGDERVMNLIRKIIASGNGVQAGKYDMVFFPNDDLFAVSRPRGLPIGNLTRTPTTTSVFVVPDYFQKSSTRIRHVVGSKPIRLPEKSPSRRLFSCRCCLIEG